MIINDLKLAIRNLAGNKLFTLINITGLSMGMTIGLLVLTIISDLTTFDTFHVNADKIFRVTNEVQFGTRDPGHRATCPLPVGTGLADQMGQLVTVTRIHKQLKGVGHANSKQLTVSGYFTDPSFFELFTFPMVIGDGRTALSSPGTVVLTQKLSRKFFGDRDPSGEILTVSRLGDFTVGGVMADAPKNSHLQFELLASYSSLGVLEANGRIEPLSESWDSFFDTYVYLMLHNDGNLGRLTTALQSIGDAGNETYDDTRIDLTLQPLKEIIPGPDLSSQIGPKMSYLPIAVLLIVALAILASACINYANLSLARSLRRAREVGIRKVLGGSRNQIFRQFLTETMMMSFVSLAIAVIIYSMAGPAFLQLLPRAGEILTLDVNFLLVALFLLLAIIAGLLSGMLPASILSSTRIISALKNLPARDALNRIGLRKGLIVFQFTLSLFLIIGILVIYRQYQFAVNKDLGFRKQDTLVVPLKSTDYTMFKNEFSSFSEVRAVSGTSDLIAGHESRSSWARVGDDPDSIQVYFMYADASLPAQLEIQLKSGSGLSAEWPKSIVINETFATTAGNEQLKAGDEVLIGDTRFVIGGIMADFHYMHLEEPIRPFFFQFAHDGVSYAYLDMSKAELKPLLGRMTASWKKLNPHELFEPVYLDDFVADTYQFYTNFMQLFGYVAFLAISIGCLGLIGMTLYASETRMKEIAIRKVHGASERSLVYILSRGFVTLLLIACLIAGPAGYFAFGELISVSAYHISIGFVELGTGIVLFLVLGLLVIVSQTIRSARSNPADVLKVD